MRTREAFYNVAVTASNSEDKGTSLLRAYFDAVTLSDGIQTRLWQAAELTLAQLRVLRRLADEPKTLGQLGLELGLAAPSVTRLVDRLEERGLVERSRNQEDRRKVLASLTPKGKQISGAVPPLLDDTAIHMAVHRMSLGEQERIAAALRDFSAWVRQAEVELALVEAQR
jgi:DNA-binding MarR family transcriptional regulator